MQCLCSSCHSAMKEAKQERTTGMHNSKSNLQIMLVESLNRARQTVGWMLNCWHDVSGFLFCSLLGRTASSANLCRGSQDHVTWELPGRCGVCPLPDVEAWPLSCAWIGVLICSPRLSTSLHNRKVLLDKACVTMADHATVKGRCWLVRLSFELQCRHDRKQC